MTAATYSRTRLGQKLGETVLATALALPLILGLSALQGAWCASSQPRTPAVEAGSGSNESSARSGNLGLGNYVERGRDDR